MGCSICQESLFGPNLESSSSTSQSQLQQAALSCGHVFHKVCIDQWLPSSSNSSCPLCNKGHHGPSLVLYIDINEDENSNSNRSSNSSANNPQPQTASSSLSYAKIELDQTLSISSLCECFAGLGMDMPDKDIYANYDDYYKEILNELVTSVVQLKSKHEGDLNELESTIHQLSENLVDSNDICDSQQQEIERLTQLLEAQTRPPTTGISSFLRRKK
ncbi:hypothetical protein IW140_004211 [Coemansia sp. RSA 1813]|nr:hypothetical protein EV178_004312 [Coemansia sp. RSA 1646]KAJ1767056.1 hypothetical protein LPJ74_005561 [Coemansia sp. RSA 1843]KAJ2088063.1 hypothetical protein IW138_004483 [Coemansia sp. RSA 986]KAJ2210777.1 hypothetical protein EV179_006009 [Coemansia sp. RSA 487]KAJ2568040.1 hypothetical protein IW140_004211 [Coemansia sp. RSA 1813]